MTTVNDSSECVCAECGHEQPSMDPCAKCHSVRVVLVSVIRDLFGEDWRRNFDPDEAVDDDEADEADGTCPHLYSGGVCELCDAPEPALKDLP